MPTYRINGKTVRSQAPLSDDEIDEIASGLGEGSAPAQPKPAEPSQPGAFQRFTEHFAPTAAFAHPRQLVEDVGNYVGGLELADLSPSRLLSPIGDIIKGAQDVVTPLMQRGLEAQDAGDTLGALGYGTQAALGSIPVFTGAVAAGNELADPSTRRAGIGATLGELANVALPFAKAPTLTAGNRLGTALQKGAQNRYVSALGPKKKFQGLAERAAIEALERGEWGTSRGLQSRARAQKATLGPELERLYKESSATVDLPGAARPSLETLGRSESIGGVEQGVRSLEQAAADELARLQATGEGGVVPVADAWRLRQIKEEPAVRRGAYLPDQDPGLSAKIEAQSTTADALRPALEKAVPESGPLNKDYSFFSNLETLLKERKVPSKLGQLARAGVGGVLLDPFIPGSSVAAAAATRAAEAILNSTVFKTGTAVLQDRIAKLLKSGDIPEAARVAQVNLPEQSLPEQLDVPVEPLPVEPTASPIPVAALAEAGINADELFAELQAIGYVPESIPVTGLSSKQLKRLAEADKKAAEIAYRTLQNPTYQALPIDAGDTARKTRATVIKNIFDRHRAPILKAIK